MKKGKFFVAAVVCLLSVAVLCEKTYAIEPYERIANVNEWEVIKLTNKERVKEGVEPIGTFTKLQKAAHIRRNEVAQVYSHTRPTGKAFYTVLNTCGIGYNYAGENIATGQISASEVVNDWMNSPGHYQNMMGIFYSHMGAGYKDSGFYGTSWVQVFAGGCNVRSVTVNDAGTVNYPRGTSVDDMNRYLIVKCNMHGTSYIPIVSEMCSGYNAKKTGYQTITVKYQDEKIKMPVTVGETSVYKQPTQVKIQKGVSKAKKTATLKWGKKKADGYEIWYATSKNGTYKKVKTITSAKTTAYRVKNLKSGKKYYFKVRAYNKVNGKKIYGAFSNTVVVKTK